MKFVHIPRTGGTSISNALGIEFIGHWVYDRNFGEFSFCVFRDPVERFVSAFNHLKYNQKNSLDRNNCREFIGDKNIHEFIENGLNKAIKKQQHFLPQHHWIPFGVNVILDFNNLEKGFKSLFPSKELPKVNGTPKVDSMLSKSEIKIINTYYKTDRIIYESVFQKYNMSEFAK